jgi:iron complex outermembrane receptor protein
LTPLKADWDNVSGKIQLDYNLNDDILLYGLISTGFKGGAFSGSSLILPEALAKPAAPEKVTSYEFGINSMLLDNTLRFNGSVFFYDYTDLQVISTTRTSTGDNSSVLENAAKAEILGADFDVLWVPVEGLNLMAAVGILDAEYSDFEIPNRGVLTDYSGRPMTNAPELTSSLRGSYEWNTDVGKLKLSADVIYSDEVLLDFTGDRNHPSSSFARASVQSKSDAHTITNVRLSWRNTADNMELAIWGKNITDEEVVSHTTFGLDEFAAYHKPPATYGVSFSYSFN